MDRYAVDAAKARVVIMYTIRHRDIPARLQLDMLDPGLRPVDSQDLVGLGRDGREIGIDDPNAAWIADGHVQQREPCQQPQFEQPAHCRIKRLGHRQRTRMPRMKDTISAASNTHPAALDPALLESQCEFQTTRRQGPGGQNRNKVETAVVLTHRPTGTIAQASECRTQGENRRAALYRLRVELALTIRRPIRKNADEPYAASELWRQRCRGGRLDVNPRHDDFPALLAEAIDVVFSCDDDPKEAALWLGCSPTQLIRFLKEAPRAIVAINERRRQAGRHPLK